MTSKTTAKRTAPAKPQRRSGIRRKRVLLKGSAEHGGLQAFNERLQARFKKAAAAAKDDAAFVLYVTTALNGKTGDVTGWVQRARSAKRKSKKDTSEEHA